MKRKWKSWIYLLQEVFLCSSELKLYREHIKMWGMQAGLLVEKLLQTLSPLLDERVVKYAIIPSERKLPEKSFSRERWHDHLRFSNRKEHIATVNQTWTIYQLVHCAKMKIKTHVCVISEADDKTIAKDSDRENFFNTPAGKSSFNIFLIPKNTDVVKVTHWFYKPDTQQLLCGVHPRDLPCSPSPAPLWATQSHCTASEH